MKFNATLLMVFVFMAVQPQGVLAGPKGSSVPLWQIMKEGTAHPVKWVDYAANRRFAVYDAETPSDPADDAVLDKETSLIWERSPSDAQRDYRNGTIYALQRHTGGRLGWRIPTAEELLSILDPTTSDHLTPDHPFLDIQAHFYWTSSALSPMTTLHWVVDLGEVNFSDTLKFSSRDTGSDTTGWHIWCVRGGHGSY